jgi:transcription antitermination factor NusG
MSQTEVRWFGVQVLPRHEKLVAISLKNKEIQEFLPLYKTRRRWSDRIQEIEQPFFQGYVFCRINPLDRLPVLMTPGVIQFVGIHKEPLPIEDHEIASLQAVVRSGLPVMPWPFLRVGQRVRISEGSLRDLEGILIHVKGVQRLVVSMNLLQRSVAVEVDREWVEPVNPPRLRSAMPPADLKRPRYQ